MKNLKIGLIQMRCEKGTIRENLDKMQRILVDAAALEIDILAFPEMNITGYIDPTRSPGAILRLDGPEVMRALAMTRGHRTMMLAGLVEHNPAGKPFITQIVIQDGELLGYYRKRTIEDEEVEWFSPGLEVPVFVYKDLTFGIAICADLGNRSVYADCSRQGAQIVFELAAPGLYGEQATRNWLSGFQWWEGECQKHLNVYTQDFGLWVAVATQAGRTVDEDFPGGGYVFAPDGRRLYATPDWRPGAVYLGIDFDTQAVKIL